MALRPGGGVEGRSAMIRSIGDLVRPSKKGLLSGAPTAEQFFQKGPITTDVLNKVYGSPDEFLDTYKKFETKYFSALEQNLKPGRFNRKAADYARKRHTINFDLLERGAADELHAEYVTKVLKLDHLMHEVGAPGIQMPSANMARLAFKFETDNTNGVTHPMQVLLNRIMINFNPEKRGLESISVGRSGLISHSMFSELWGKMNSVPTGIKDRVTQQMKPLGEISAGQKVITFDVETSGVLKNSHVRSMAMAEMTADQHGNLGKAVSLEDFSFNFASEHFNGIRVGSLNEGTKSLNEFIAGFEHTKLGDMGNAGENFLDASTKFINRLLEADKVVGHNVGFDLDMMTRTMTSQPAFQRHKGAQEALDKLHDRISQGGFLHDTADSARTYLLAQAQQETAAPGAAFLDDRTNQFISNLMSSEHLAKVKIGGSATYADVGNIALNTNLFELIEKDQSAAEEIYSKITAGSHIADTDVHLQSYVAKYMQSGELKIRSKYLKEGGALSDFGDFARSKIAKSAAITATTDMTSVQNISQETLSYLKSEEGMKGITLSVNEQLARDLGVGAQHGVGGPGPFNKGFLKFNGQDYQFVNARGTMKIDRDLAESTILQHIDLASQKETQQNLRIGSKNLNVSRNIADEAFLSLGFSYRTASMADDITRIKGINISKSLTEGSMLEGLTEHYKYAKGYGVGDIFKRFSNRKNEGYTMSPFQRGIKEISKADTVTMAEKAARIGDPYAHVTDPLSRIFGSIIAEATAPLTREAGLAAETELTAAAKLTNNIVDKSMILHTQHADMLSSLGMATFRKQQTTRLLKMQGEEILPSSKLMVHNDIIDHIFKNSEQLAKDAGMTKNLLESDKGQLLGLSLVRNSEKGSSLNVFLDVQRQFGQEGAQQLATHLYDLFTDTIDAQGKVVSSARSKVSSALGVKEHELSSDLNETIQQFSMLAEKQGGRDMAINEMANFMQRGVVIGNAPPGGAVQSIVENIQGLGYELDNEGNLMQRAYKTNVNAKGYIGAELWHDPEAAKIAGVTDELERLARPVDIGNGTMMHRAQIAGKEVVEEADRTGILPDLSRKVSQARDGFGPNKLLELYNANKKNVAIGAAALAAAGFGYYISKRHREKDLYNETLEQQPTQKARPVRTANYNNSNQFSQGNTSNPLATAGLVNNLDRMKINHTRMGSQKYSHLFGG